MPNKEILYKQIAEYLRENLKVRERSRRTLFDDIDCEPRMVSTVCRRVIDSKPKEKRLDEYIKGMDKPFSRVLFDYIDKVGINDVECYKRANVDKKTFSKIKCSEEYRPSKKTAVSFAIALRLNLEETEHLLKTAGYALSKSSKFDLIIEYFIKTGDYESIDDINEALYQFDQPTLGV